MPRRHAVGVALRHRLHDPTVVQWRKAVSMPEGINRVGHRRRAAGHKGNDGDDVLKRKTYGLRSLATTKYTSARFASLVAVELSWASRE